MLTLLELKTCEFSFFMLLLSLSTLSSYYITRESCQSGLGKYLFSKRKIYSSNILMFLYKIRLTFNFYNRLNLPYNFVEVLAPIIRMLNVTFLSTPFERKEGSMYLRTMSNKKTYAPERRHHCQDCPILRQK